MTVPAQTSPRTAQHTLLATRHSTLIVPDLPWTRVQLSGAQRAES